jgi:F-type H+-transporting ATPase subunit gamma
MSETTASLRRKISSAGDLQSVVRTMKVISASSIGQYENAVHSLDEYYRTVQLGLTACFQQNGLSEFNSQTGQNKVNTIAAVVFGSDQGLVGQFNEAMSEFVSKTLDNLPGEKKVWVIGERLKTRLEEKKLLLGGSFPLPNSIGAITPLVGQILIELDKRREKGEITEVYLFYNRPTSGSTYTSVSLRLLPLDDVWRDNIATIPWPSGNLPQVMNNNMKTLLAFVNEYLFLSLFRACAESLASESASRLAAMQRAEKNIEELLEDLNRSFHRMRQSAIDEELFDVISGFNALTKTAVNIKDKDEHHAR